MCNHPGSYTSSFSRSNGWILTHLDKQKTLKTTFSKSIALNAWSLWPLYDSLDDPALRTTSRREQSCRPANAAWTHRSRTLKFSHWQHKCIARLLDCSTSIWWSLGKLRTFDWLLCYGHNNSSITLGTLEGQHGDAFVKCCECNCLSVFCLSLQTLFGYLVSHSCIICSFVTAPLAAAKCIQILRWSHMPRSSRTSISCFMCLNVFSVFEFFGHLHPSGF